MTVRQPDVVSGSDFLSNIGFNNVLGYSRAVALGNNPDIDTGAHEDVWSVGGLYPWMAAATALEVVSSSANDAVAGTGARTVLVVGLDANFNPVSQTVTLNGLTPVALPTPLLRVNSAVIMSAGSGEVNAGNIDVRRVAGGTVQCRLPAGYGISRQSIYTVPAGSTLQVLALVLGINRPTAARDCTVAVMMRNAVTGMFRMPLELSVSGGPPYPHHGNPGIIVGEKTDFSLRCTYTSSDNLDLTAGWLGIQKLNSAS